MSRIKAIETIYNGYRFRSRLEARWAVFFDAIGVKWEYEREGFYNEKGDKYLPDFYLPDYDIWCEVKPNDKTRAEEVIKACSFVTKDMKIRALIFLPNIPETSNYNSLFWYRCAYYDTLCEEVRIPRVLFSCYDLGDTSEEFHIISNFAVGRESVFGGSPYVNWDCVHDFDMPYPRRQDGEKWCYGEYMKTTKLDKAYAKARQARFEHGETPT